jgi:hypothetical protein
VIEFTEMLDREFESINTQLTLPPVGYSCPENTPLTHIEHGFRIRTRTEEPFGGTKTVVRPRGR